MATLTTVNKNFAQVDLHLNVYKGKVIVNLYDHSGMDLVFSSTDPMVVVSNVVDAFCALLTLDGPGFISDDIGVIPVAPTVDGVVLVNSDDNSVVFMDSGVIEFVLDAFTGVLDDRGLTRG